MYTTAAGGSPSAPYLLLRATPTVPAFHAAPLSLSSIVLRATAGTLTAPADFLATLLPMVPTAQHDLVLRYAAMRATVPPAVVSLVFGAMNRQRA